MNLATELKRLLAEDRGAAGERACAALGWDPAADRPLVLVGAGTIGTTVLQALGKENVSPIAFADDTPAKQGTMIKGVPILPVEDAVKRYGKHGLFAVTIINPNHRYVNSRARLQALGCANVCSVLHLTWKFPKSLLPFYQFTRPEQLLGDRDKLQDAFRLFRDEESQHQFLALLKFRLHLDYECIPPNSHDEYFPPDVLPALEPGSRFVDCGAYRGDTLARFLDVHGDAFDRALAFEPDGVNCQALEAYVRSLAPSVREKIDVSQSGLGNEDGLQKFSAAGSMSSALSSSGDVAVRIRRLDDLLETAHANTYIKMDIEGAEMDALRGASTSIQRDQPRLAVCVYHRPEDIWSIPLYLASLVPQYQFYLRTQGEDGMDCVCYAMPN